MTVHRLEREPVRLHACAGMPCCSCRISSNDVIKGGPLLPLILSLGQITGRLPVDSIRGKPGVFLQKRAHCSSCAAFWNAPNSLRGVRNPASRDPAIAIRILRQILLVKVGAEAFVRCEIATLRCRWQSIGRLSVDVAVTPAVDRYGLRSYECPALTASRHAD
jgi:hypothetical protein